jgi:TetR/AcrR family transcriptional regulator
MRQECSTKNTRLKWVADTFVMPLINRLLPQIAALQKSGQLLHMKPIVFHYMMISLTSTLSEFGPEISVTGKLDDGDPGIVQSYWRTVKTLIFCISPPDIG